MAKKLQGGILEFGDVVTIDVFIDTIKFIQSTLEMDMVMIIGLSIKKSIKYYLLESFASPCFLFDLHNPCCHPASTFERSSLNSQ